MHAQDEARAIRPIDAEGVVFGKIDQRRNATGGLGPQVQTRFN